MSLGPSAAAQEFLAESSRANWATVDLHSADAIKELRSENSEVAEGFWADVQRDWDVDVAPRVEIREETLGGVACQWVSPGGKTEATEETVILYFYGGAFAVGSPEDDLCMTARLATFSDMSVCVPRYRLAPENPFPAAKNDAVEVYRALVRATKRRVVLVGESAGGNLALQVALHALDDDTLASPLALVLMSPWIDLTHGGDSHTTSKGLDPTLSVEHFLEPAARAYAGGTDLASSDISPLFADIPAAQFPPTLISTATRDLLLSDAVRLAAKLRSAACDVDLRVAEGLWHVYEWLVTDCCRTWYSPPFPFPSLTVCHTKKQRYPGLPEAKISLEQIAKFVQTQR
jgi:epsilon-lactone hydrolase